MVFEIVSLSLLVGSISGFLAGLFGIGGGLVIVPALVIIFERYAFPKESIMLIALATSLASILVTSWVSATAHHRMKAVIWPLVFRLAPGILIGTSLGAVYAERLASNTLKWIFCGFLSWVAAQLLMKRDMHFIPANSGKIFDSLAGVVIGFISALVGIGGGTLSVPYLVGKKIPVKNAVAISSACGFPIALAGSVSYSILGWQLQGLPAWSVGYVYLPAFIGIVCLSTVTAPFGARLTHRLPTQKLKRYFAFLLLVVAIKMLT